MQLYAKIQAMKRILLVKTSSMGDIIHNMPLVADIKIRFPDVIIDWVVEEGFAELAALNPLVSEVIPVAMRRWKKALFAKRTWSEFFAFRRRLRQHTYDAIIDTQGLIKSAIICRMANGVSHGQNTGTAREAIAGLLYQNSHHNPYSLHAITRNRHLGALALGYSPPVTPPEYHIVVPSATLPLDLPEHFVMGFHSTAREAKHWPIENWVQIGRHLTARNLGFLLPWGNPAELERALTIAGQLNNAIVLPKMTLTELCCLISRAQAAIGLDTGLTHIAVALNIPTLAIFTDTHLWQAGAMPSASGLAITIGGKPAAPPAAEAIQAFEQLPQKLFQSGT